MSCLVSGFLVAVLGLGAGCGGFETVAAQPPQPSMVAQPPQPSAVATQPSAVATQPSAVATQPSAVATQPSAVATQPSAVATQLSAVATQPPTVVAEPLAGRVIVIDPGHQLGNHNFPTQISRPVPAGGFDKPCNTTGTSTDSGFPEATFSWDVSQRLRIKLQRLGASVLLTRYSNSEQHWGPCVDVRGRAGNTLPASLGGGRADLKISIHGDGSYAAGARGFHVIYPPDRAPWTSDIYRSSAALALDTRSALEAYGFPLANYVAGGDGLDVRSDLATLNLSDVPTVLVECGNMRNAADAAVMSSRAGQGRYAAGLTKAVRRFLG